MDERLKRKAIFGVMVTPLMFGLPLFVSAGTLNYWQGWLFLAVFVIATILHTVYLAKNDPELLERRMRAGPTAEKRTVQQIVMAVVTALFFLILVLGGLDHRFGWSALPFWIPLSGDALIALSYVGYFFVFRQNRFAAATIDVVEGQTVISTGLYGIVRHPMYAAGLLMFFGMPLAVGSLYALVPVFFALPVLIWRLLDEEKCLAENLNGYKEYCAKVKYRLVPGIF